MNNVRSWLLILALGCQAGAMAGDLAQRTPQGLDYLSGGVGEDERQAMLAARDEYNLRMTFATRISGEYLADVALTVFDRTGTPVATATSDGPWCYLKLDPGSYRVVATMHGKALQQTVVIKPNGARELYFYWDPQ